MMKVLPFTESANVRATVAPSVLLLNCSCEAIVLMSTGPGSEVERVEQRV